MIFRERWPGDVMRRSFLNIKDLIYRRSAEARCIERKHRLFKHITRHLRDVSVQFDTDKLNRFNLMMVDYMIEYNRIIYGTSHINVSIALSELVNNLIKDSAEFL